MTLRSAVHEFLTLSWLHIRGLALLALLMLLSACSEHDAHSGHTTVPGADEPVQRVQDFARIANGKRVFTRHCAECHGANAEGDPNWRYRDASGQFPPPALNGTAHAWHHPLDELHGTIRDGVNNMPAWGAVLSPEEIDDTIAWFQSLWPDEVYAAWHGIDQRARNAARQR